MSTLSSLLLLTMSGMFDQVCICSNQILEFSLHRLLMQQVFRKRSLSENAKRLVDVFRIYALSQS